MEELKVLKQAGWIEDNKLRENFSKQLPYGNSAVVKNILLFSISD